MGCHFGHWRGRCAPADSTPMDRLCVAIGFRIQEGGGGRAHKRWELEQLVSVDLTEAAGAYVSGALATVMHALASFEWI